MTNEINPIQPAPTAQPIRLVAEIETLRTAFETNLPWLDKAFGRAYSKQEQVNNDIVTFPKVPVGLKRYYSCLPNRNLQSYCFFRIEDDTESYNTLSDGYSDFSTYNLGIIFWFDTRKVINNDLYRFDEANEVIKQTIIQVIRNSTVDYAFGQAFEGYENVFQGYTIGQIEQQYLSDPFYGFRFVGTLKVDKICEDISI